MPALISSCAGKPGIHFLPPAVLYSCVDDPIRRKHVTDSRDNGGFSHALQFVDISPATKWVHIQRNEIAFSAGPDVGMKHAAAV